MKAICDFCGEEFVITNRNTMVSHLRNARIKNMSFCDVHCSALFRRRTDAEKREVKRLYDLSIIHRRQTVEAKAKRAQHFQYTYDPVKSAIERKKNMHKHVEYCRQPKYKVKKHIYDITRNAKKSYGEFYESALLVKEILTEIGGSKQMRLDVGLNNNKTQKRKRNGNNKRS